LIRRKAGSTLIANLSWNDCLRGSHLTILTLVGFLSLFAILSVAPTYAQIQNSITVTTDKASYSEGEIILVTGEVRDLYSGTPVSVIVKAPNGNLVFIENLTVGTDKKFNTQLDAGGALMKVEGTYTVIAQYGNASRSATTSFEFGGSTATSPPSEEESKVTDTTVSVQGSSDLVGYEITGGKLLNIIPDVDALSLIVNIDSFNDGLLTLILPRTVIDARIDNDDSKFFILVDGEEKTYFEFVSSTDRIIIIHFKAGAEEIEIIGTHLSERGLPASNINPTPSYPSPTYDTTPPKILKPTDITVNAKNQNGAIVTFDVLAIDDTDNLVNTTCNPSSTSFFGIGETRVVCNARDSSGNRAIPVSFNITVNAAGSVIPEWVKNVAAFWCDNKIDDTSFIEGIQYLIDNDIITVSVTNPSSGFTQDIPQWVKNNACWWSKGLITDKDFASGIEFLVKAGIIRV